MGAFKSWEEFVWLRKRLKHLALKVFNRLANAQLYGAWEIWFQGVVEQKEKEREEYERQFLLGKEKEEADRKLAEAEEKKQRGLEMIQRMINGALANTMIAWKAGVAQMKKERVMLERFSKRLMMRCAVSSLVAWREYVSRRKWIRGLMMRMIGGKTSKKLYASLRRWERYVAHLRVLEIEHGTTDQSDLLEKLYVKVEELEAQNVLLISQLGEAKYAKQQSAKRR